jgi:cutinase
MTPALASGAIGIPSAHADPCPNAEVVFARGTGEPPGVGKVGQSFVDSLRSQVNGRSLGVYPINYPATPSFAASANDGANDASAHVQDMVARCPNTQMVLGGFSQGAGVIALATAALPPAASDHVAAVALFGNPSSALASSLAGIAFPAIGPLYNSKTIDLCATDDPACSGGMNLLAHGSYVQSGMTSQAATFVAGRL